MSIAGSTVRTLSPEDLLIYLLIHGGKHAWFRLGWLCDLTRILHRHPDLDWDIIIMQIEDLGLRRILDQAMYLACTLFSVSVPDEVKLPTSPDRQTVYLINTALQAMLDPRSFDLDWHTLPFKKVVEAAWYRLKFQRSFRYKADVILKMLVRPQDWDDVPLPRLLFPLYYPLNPILFILRRFSQS